MSTVLAGELEVGVLEGRRGHFEPGNLDIVRLGPLEHMLEDGPQIGALDQQRELPIDNMPGKVVRKCAQVCLRRHRQAYAALSGASPQLVRIESATKRPPARTSTR